MPPVTTTSTSPARIIESAISIARIDDAQTLLIVSAGVSFGRPAPIAACRAGAWPAPACSTWPMITYCGSCGSSPIRSSAAAIAIGPELRRLVPGEPAAEPAERRPDGADDHAARHETKLAQEAGLGREPAGEGDDEPDHRLEIVERGQARPGRPYRSGIGETTPVGDSASSSDMNGIGIGPCLSGVSLERMRNSVRLGRRNQ